MSCDQDLLIDQIDFVMLDSLISGQLLIRYTKHRIILINLINSIKIHHHILG